MKSSCCDSKKIKTVSSQKVNGFSSFFTTLLIILLPKCPLCIGAYAGAALLFFDIEGSDLAPYFVHIRPLLGVFILVLILMNNRGRKTIISATITAIALVFLLLSIYAGVAIFPLWMIYLIFVLSIWLNGNFEYFFNFIRAKFQTAT